MFKAIARWLDPDAYDAEGNYWPPKLRGFKALYDRKHAEFKANGGVAGPPSVYEWRGGELYPVSGTGDPTEGTFTKPSKKQ